MRQGSRAGEGRVGPVRFFRHPLRPLYRPVCITVCPLVASHKPRAPYHKACVTWYASFVTLSTPQTLAAGRSSIYAAQASKQPQNVSTTSSMVHAPSPHNISSNFILKARRSCLRVCHVGLSPPRCLWPSARDLPVTPSLPPFKTAQP